jgi:hypothetical protein
VVQVKAAAKKSRFEEERQAQWAREKRRQNEEAMRGRKEPPRLGW